MTVGDALPREMARVRDEVMPAFDAAARAMAEGDVIAMIRLLGALKEYEP